MMECLKEEKMLKFRPKTLEFVRKDVNLHQPGRMDEAINILEDWIQKQTHFVKKDFSRGYLERTLVMAKGLTERAKERLDKICTFRTLMPDFFLVSDAKQEFEPLKEVIACGHLPHLTSDYHRLFMVKMISEDIDSSILLRFYKYITSLTEYLMQVEYCAGFQIIIDFSNINVLSFATKVNPMDLRQIVTVMTEGYGIRIKGIHVITSSKMVDAVISLLKQIFSTKLADRIHVYKTVESLSKVVPKENMAADFGGDGLTLAEINKAWVEILSSSEFLEYIKDMGKAKTNESCRQGNDFNEHYIGMPGSFRALSVD